MYIHDISILGEENVKEQELNCHEGQHRLAVYINPGTNEVYEVNKYNLKNRCDSRHICFELPIIPVKVGQ